jgi:hypothetical protein
MCVCGWLCAAQLVAIRKKFGQSLEVLREYQGRIVELESAAKAADAALKETSQRHAVVVDAHTLEVQALRDSVRGCAWLHEGARGDRWAAKGRV